MKKPTQTQISNYKEALSKSVKLWQYGEYRILFKKDWRTGKYKDRTPVIHTKEVAKVWDIRTKRYCLAYIIEYKYYED